MIRQGEDLIGLINLFFYLALSDGTPTFGRHFHTGLAVFISREVESGRLYKEEDGDDLLLS